jgi:hypothetical protein
MRGDARRACRLLTEDDTAAFCHTVSEALAAGRSLYRSPADVFDAASRVMRCVQAVVKDVDRPCSPDLKLGSL